MPINLPETRLVHALLRLHGHPVDGFSARLMPDGAICITGPHSASFYPDNCWTSLFLHHLRRGFFDPAPVDRRRAAA
jgi:hypothetical protein